VSKAEAGEHLLLVGMSTMAAQPGSFAGRRRTDEPPGGLADFHVTGTRARHLVSRRVHLCSVLQARAVGTEHGASCALFVRRSSQRLVRCPETSSLVPDASLWGVLCWHSFCQPGEASVLFCLTSRVRSAVGGERCMQLRNGSDLDLVRPVRAHPISCLIS
jgi:hypothetical protein